MLQTFGPSIKEFEITVPNDFGPFKDHLVEYAGTGKFRIENYHHKLQAGKTYKVNIFPIMIEASGKQCLEFFRERQALVVGEDDLGMAFQLKNNEFVLDICYNTVCGGFWRKMISRFTPTEEHTKHRIISSFVDFATKRFYTYGRMVCFSNI